PTNNWKNVSLTTLYFGPITVISATDINLAARWVRLAFVPVLDRPGDNGRRSPASVVNRGGKNDQSPEALRAGRVGCDRRRVWPRRRRHLGRDHRRRAGAGLEAQFDLRPGRVQVSARAATWSWSPMLSDWRCFRR